MKSIWTTLQIDPTSDTKAIRQAYAKQLQLKNPEIDPTGFQVLRTAYEEALGKAAANKSPKTQDVNSPVQAESPRSIVIGMPKAHDSVAQNAEPPTSNRISGMPKAPEVHDEVKQAPPDAFLLAAGMVDRLSSCREEAEMLNLFRQWREEGAFNHVGVSLHFQTELLKEFSGQPKLHARLFAAAYSLFSWGELLQKPSHPHVKILSRLIKQNHLSDILSLLEKTAGQPFFQSVAIDDVGSAAKYLQSNPQILHETDDEGNNALHIACEAGAIACAEFLARQGIALDEGNSSGQTPLNLAVDANSPQLVEILCKAGADINHADGEGLTPLYLAVIHSQDDIIECLCGFPNLECRPDVLCAAVASGRPELVRYFLDLGWEASPEGVTEPPLITAARLNLMEILNDLLDAGADTSQTNKRGKTALQIAAERGFLEIVERLLQYDLEDNAVINAANQAITHGHFKIVERILDALELTTPMKIINFRGIKSSMHSHGFASCLDDLFLSLEALDYTKPLTAESLPPLIQAVYKGDLPALEQALPGGADIRETLQNGLAPLHVSILMQRHECFDYLLRHHADIDQVAGPHNFSPLFIAVKTGNLHAYRTLMDLGAKDLPTGSRHTALYAAVYKNDMPIVAELLARGSDLYQYAGEGLRTLVYAAARHGHHGMLKYLIARGLSPDFIAGDLWTPLCINYMACPEAVVTPLAVAVKTLDLEMIGILLQAGADPNRKSIGIPPLHLAMGSPFSARESVDYYAQMERSHAAIDLLLQYGADINAQSDDGQTFLSKVVSAGLMETAMHLVESGADLHLPGSQGKLPVDYAREAQNAIMTRYLEQEMKLRPKLAAHQLIEKFMSSYLEPALKKRGYQRHEGTWWQSRGDYFLVIHMQPFSWITDGFAFCFNIGAAKSSDLRNTDNDRVIIDDCFAHAPETAFLSGSWEKHPFKRNVGYSVTEHAQPANFIRALTEDFENEILPCLESLDSLEDITEKLAVKFDLN